jgi:DNA-binding transcriptional ArsR family regulator
MIKGYQVGESIMLDITFGIGAETYDLNYFQKEAVKIWTQSNKIISPNISQDFLTDWKSLWAEDIRAHVIIMHLADLADAIFIKDYEKAKKKMQQLDFDTAYKKILSNANDYKIIPEKDFSLRDNFANLALKTRIEDHKIAGLNLENNSQFLNTNKKQYKKLVDVLSDGINFNQFWDLLDQYHYTILSPWRKQRKVAIEMYREQTINEVGGKSFSQNAPKIDWLSSQHPMQMYQQLNRLITQNKMHSFFWIDPFNFTNILSLRHNYLIASCNNHFVSQEKLNSEIEQLTLGLKAISDPTRLKILRLIRYFSMDNTQMAQHLGISRPTVSNHTKVLREANLIDSETIGRSTKHFVNADNINQLIAHLSVFLDVL